VGKGLVLTASFEWKYTAEPEQVKRKGNTRGAGDGKMCPSPVPLLLCLKKLVSLTHKLFL